jgi:hypothetical protein
VAGQRVWVGDVNAVQGDGVVDQTSIETAAEELEIRYTLHKAVPLRAPLIETETSWIGRAWSAWKPASAPISSVRTDNDDGIGSGRRAGRMISASVGLENQTIVEGLAACRAWCDQHNRTEKSENECKDQCAKYWYTNGRISNARLPQ